MIAAGGLIRTARLAEHDPPVSAKTVFLAGQQGEAEATALIESAGRYLGIGLASLINVFNPQAIVIGGGLMNMGETILGPALETARARTFAQSFTDVRIVEGELGERRRPRRDRRRAATPRRAERATSRPSPSILLLCPVDSAASSPSRSSRSLPPLR